MKITEVFCEPPEERLLAALRQLNVSHEILLDTVYFKLCQDSKAYRAIIPFTAQKDRIQIVSFLEAERSAAAWLEIAPRSPSVEILNEDEAFAFSCTYIGEDGAEHAQHRRQVAPFEVKDEVKWAKRKLFTAPDDGGSELFTCGAVKQLVKDANITGCGFLTVFNRKTGMPCKDTFQLTARTEIPMKSISLGRGETEQLCPLCGKKQYVLENTYQLHLVQHLLPTTVDIIRTPAVFHDGQAEAVTLISQRFYQTLKGAGLCYGLDFTPAILESQT